MGKSREMDMLHGPVFGKIWVFAFPLMLSGMLQLLYNAADLIVVGNEVGKTALAAVGCTGAMVNLIVNLFMGLSVGSSVAVAQAYGAGCYADVSDAVHTSMAISLIGSVLVGLVGFIACRPLLLLMGTPETVVDLSVLYVRIYFCGMPAIGVYNFGAAILRAVGDTRRPMLFLIFSGLINVALNLVFVLVFHMGVAGVSLATVISQCVAACMTVCCLMRADGCVQLHLRELRICRDKLKSILYTGLPAGLQSSLFSLSNMLIQSSINSFGDVVMAGNTAASNLDGFAYVALNSFSQAAITFTGQNVGARRWDRLRRVCSACAVSVMLTGFVIGAVLVLGGRPLLSLYDTDPQVIEAGMIRLQWLATTYFLCGFMEMLVGMMRGMGKSVLPMVVSLLGACVLRVVWIYTLFVRWKELWVVYASYPVSWFVTASVHFCCFLFIYHRRMAQWKKDNPAVV